ncbi:hypothetical protein A3C91_00170 [Candidatus Azambacteria bacterium RIFCSPHIGHO2_02_FULL_52_12]|uniref:Uncharacterized protein n=1 Tax=Candidatus Azambacteria bacterium RIFCSPLOWO2_01_FULL_46_25 TaxID=1797298 RepID=A0A1F5BUM3_9BACT|nr:MAG: hypothetical protein A3C91_00170 [Candidatus Azambacteria bacterium RIFCSPHIGHO2_02_FULL_52_12]OGD34317.1 MAG: hypothetical protein A2988_02190 [Candidatus Azambacteria bacterium RIFCSPLOWO2_01_FULL_46_25]OGD37835.1 MAG: hypothetical protein A2850_02985 [Candidatus Azambacteria bacterium RIFCSPHIGHO2_01_FULL_51_74]
MNRTLIIIIFIVIIVFALGAGYYFYAPSGNAPSAGQNTPSQGRVIEEKLVIPDTKSITGSEGRVVDQGAISIALVPKDDNEKVIVPGAVLSVKGSYDLAKPEAAKWSSDAQLAFIKSLGAVTLEGKSSQWQIAFSSKIKKGKGYEVVIQGDGIVSQKEVDSGAVGGETPPNFADRDSLWALAQLAAIPQFQTASISAIIFSYNPDAKGWDYIIPNSFGKSAVRVR